MIWQSMVLLLTSESLFVQMDGTFFTHKGL